MKINSTVGRIAAMFQVNEVIVYGAHGVCKITGTEKNSATDCLSTPVFLLQNLCHFLRGFFTAVCKPKLDDGIQTVAEEFDVVFEIF